MPFLLHSATSPHHWVRIVSKDKKKKVKKHQLRKGILLLGSKWIDITLGKVPGTSRIFIFTHHLQLLIFPKGENRRKLVRFSIGYVTWMLGPLLVLTNMLSDASRHYFTYHSLRSENYFSAMVKYGKIIRKLITSIFSNPPNYLIKMQNILPQNQPTSQLNGRTGQVSTL